MAFENLNYSTEEKIDDESIQDKIDQGKLNIKQLTKENLNKLKVDILYNNSHLNVRDIHWNIISDVKDNQIIGFNGKKYTHMYKWTEKIFLWVTFENWDKWYVSADYVKWDLLVENQNTNEKVNPLPEDNTEAQPLSSKKIEKKPLADNKIEKKPLSEDKEVKYTIKNSIPKIEKKYDWNYKETKEITTDKDKSLEENPEEKIIKKIEEKHEEGLNQEAIDKLLNPYPKLLILKDIVEVWTNAAEVEKNTELWTMFGIWDKKAIEYWINQANTKFNILWEKIQNLESVSDNEINEVFTVMLNTEKEETIVDNMKAVKKELGTVTTENIKDSRLKILDLMRGWAIQEWSSVKVEEKLRPDILKQKEFANVEEIINNPELFKYLEDDNIDKLVEMWINKDLAKKSCKAYSRVRALQLKNIDTYKEYIKINEPTLNDKELTDKAEVYGEISSKKAITDLLSKALIFDKFDSNPWLISGNNTNKLYSDLVWVWSFNFSDETISNSVEVGSLLVISLIPMWVWISASVLAARLWTGLIRVSRLASVAEKWWKLWTVAKYTWIWITTALEWTAFYEWYNIINNVLYKEHYTNLLEWAWNTTEIAKSIAFFWILKWLSKIWELEKIKNLTDKVPDWIIKKSWAVLSQAWILTWAWYGTDYAFEKKGWDKNADPSLTWEQYIENMIMVILFRKFGGKTEVWNKEKLEIEMDLKPKVVENVEVKGKEKVVENVEVKEKEKVVENVEWVPNSSVEYYENTKTWEKITKTADWVFLDSKWKQLWKADAVNTDFLADLKKIETEKPVSKNEQKSTEKKVDENKTKVEINPFESYNKTINESKTWDVILITTETLKFKLKKLDNGKFERVWEEVSSWSYTIQNEVVEPTISKEGNLVFKNITNQEGKLINKELIVNKVKNVEKIEVGKVEAKVEGKVEAKVEGKVEAKVEGKVEESNKKNKEKSEKDKTKEKIEEKEIKKNLDNKISAVWKSAYNKIFSWLSKSWKAKINKSWWEDWFIKELKENLWKKIWEDYKWWRFLSWTLKIPIRVWIFWVQQTWHYILSPAWRVASELSPIKLYKDLTWKQKLIWWLTTSTIYEYISKEDNESITDNKHLVNIPINGLNLATFWFWTILSEPMMNTIYWKLKWFEQRDFLPAYIDNTIGILNISWSEMPYELWESLLLTDKEVLIKTIEEFKKNWYEWEIIKKLEKKLSELK